MLRRLSIGIRTSVEDAIPAIPCEMNPAEPQVVCRLFNPAVAPDRDVYRHR